MTLSIHCWRKWPALLLPLILTGCGDGKDGSEGVKGAPGQIGNSGLHSLVNQKTLPAGDWACPKGGLLMESGLDDNSDGTLVDAEVDNRHSLCKPGPLNTQYHFNRIATFAVCSQTGSSCTSAEATSAEIVAASSDGMTLVYTNSPAEQV